MLGLADLFEYKRSSTTRNRILRTSALKERALKYSSSLSINLTAEPQVDPIDKAVGRGFSSRSSSRVSGCTSRVIISSTRITLMHRVSSSSRIRSCFLTSESNIIDGKRTRFVDIASHSPHNRSQGQRQRQDQSLGVLSYSDISSLFVPGLLKSGLRPTSLCPISASSPPISGLLSST